MGEIDFSRFDAVTFDCYGTLIDWEQGILNALQPVLAPQGIDLSEDELLERYARHEAALEAGAVPAVSRRPRGLAAQVVWRARLRSLRRRCPRVRAGARRLAGLSGHGARTAPSAASGSGSA